jgi:hypothetical protein
MDYGALIQAAVSIVGELLAADKEDEAKALLTHLRTQVAGIPLPSLDEIKAQQLEKSQLDAYTADPRLEQAQMDTLGALGDVTKNGLADVDNAALNNIANRVNRRQRAGAAGIEADMAGRGLAGSGLDYATRAAMASDANQQLSEAGQNIGAEALQRRIQALGQRGELAGKIRGQGFDEAAKKAEAADTINRINAGMRERAQYYNANLPQQRFQNSLTKVGAMANPTNAVAAMNMQGANSTRDLYAGLGAAASRYTDSSGRSSSSNTSTYGSSRKKKDDEEDDELKPNPY